MTNFFFNLLLVGAVFLVFLEITSGEELGQCIEGLYHKSTPSPETEQFQTCHAWKDNSCCTSEFTVELMANQTRNLYNHSWHRCGQLSPECQEFWIKQECFYQCSPFVYKWKHPSINGALEGVPVCSEFCNSWFEACKTDQICVENVLEHYNFSVHGENFCPSDKNCTSYASMYGNGKGLCEKMWGGSYIYVEANTNQTNCLLVYFNGTNPNGNVNPPANPNPNPNPAPPSVAPTIINMAVINCAALFMVAVFLNH